MDSGESPPFGAVLERHRLAAGLTHEALAERAGLSARAISDLERGVARAPRPASLRLLADALGLAPEARAALAAAARPAAGAGTPAAPGRRHNLPAPLTSFVGREREVAAVREASWARDARLVTLTGPRRGGEDPPGPAVAAVASPRRYPDGVWLVALAARPTRRGARHRGAGRGRARGAGPALPAALRPHLRARRLLLVLDNCEHVLGARRWWPACWRPAPACGCWPPAAAPLRVAGEREVAVPPALPRPAPAGPRRRRSSVSRRCACSPSGRRGSQAGFAVTDENAPGGGRHLRPAGRAAAGAGAGRARAPSSSRRPPCWPGWSRAWGC